MTTIRDIAQAAGVSIGTVSNYLNDPAMVAEETRDRIAAVVRELDYHPRAAARSLKSRQTHRIGLVPIISTVDDNRSNDPGDNAFLELLAGLNTLATQNGFDILISGATNYEQELKTYDRFVGEAQVDGLIIMGIHPQDERLKILKAKNFPFVAYGRSDLDFAYPFVDVDGATGIVEAIHHLAELGHRRIAYITPPADLMCASQRFDGFVKGMKEVSLGLREEYVIHGEFNEAAGIAVLKNCWTYPSRPPPFLLPMTSAPSGPSARFKNAASRWAKISPSSALMTLPWPNTGCLVSPPSPSRCASSAST
jgi:DNA-binding LacI/PurR family transcriptional regulator